MAQIPLWPVAPEPGVNFQVLQEMNQAGKYDKKQHLENAIALMESDDTQSLRYACLELRFLIEAHVYERLLHGIEELPRTVIETWQPDKAIKEFLKFDDLADKNMVLTLSDADGSKLTEIKYHNLPVRELVKIYNSLGSYLHLATPKKIATYKIVKEKIQTLVDSLKSLVEGNLMIVKLNYESFSCESCNSSIIYTSNYLENNEKITCQTESCKIEYFIKKEEGKVSFGSKYVFECHACKNPEFVFFSKIADGYRFNCQSCNKEYNFEMVLHTD